MNEKPKLSIIVPVHNVKVYLEKCIDSILNQSFKHFELILVDDGSTDGSEIICDEYALKDKRIKVIHKNNGGASSAKNQGLNIAIGDYIGFVDSDDWIESDMYELLYNLITKEKKDIANIGIKFIYEDFEYSFSKHEEIILSKFEAIEKLLEYKLYADYFCTNLFKASLIKRFKFKENVCYEDLDLMYRIIHESNGLVTVGIEKYNYLQRNNSFSKNNSSKILEDKFIICNERGFFLKDNYFEIYKKIEKNIRKDLIDIFFNYLKTKISSKEKIGITKIIKVLNNYFYENLKTKEFSLNIKIQLLLLKFFPNLYMKVFKLKFKL